MKTHKRLPVRWVVVIFILIGIVLRILAAAKGHTYDMESYEIVAKIVTSGGNVYAQTTRYNYGPLWFLFLGSLYKLALLTPVPFATLRFLIVGFLSVVDAGLFLFLHRRYGMKIAVLAFFNPIGILLTGYYSQFDNLALFIALVAVVLLEHETHFSKKKVGGLVLLGASLVIKHICFAFPVWLAVRENGWKRKFAVIAIPMAVFLLSFVPYAPKAGLWIVNNVLLYTSYNNAPLWFIVVPDLLKFYISKYIFFFGALLIGAWVFRRWPLMEAFLWYSAVLVACSPAIAAQYFAIVLPFIAIYWNGFFLAFTLVQTLYMWMMALGGTLVIRPLHIYIDHDSFNYANQIVLLAFGAVFAYWWQDERRRTVRHTIAALVVANLILFTCFFVPSIMEDRRVRAIERAIAEADYERANMLYEVTQHPAPFAGSRYWYKLTHSRKTIEYYRSWRRVLDLYNTVGEKDWEEIWEKLDEIPAGSYFQESVASIAAEARRHVRTLHEN